MVNIYYIRYVRRDELYQLWLNTRAKLTAIYIEEISTYTSRSLNYRISYI
jgi:hypothetical protein